MTLLKYGKEKIPIKAMKRVNKGIGAFCAAHLTPKLWLFFKESLNILFRFMKVSVYISQKIRFSLSANH